MTPRHNSIKDVGSGGELRPRLSILIKLELASQHMVNLSILTRPWFYRVRELREAPRGQ